MKLRLICSTALFALAAPAIAQTYSPPVVVETAPAPTAVIIDTTPAYPAERIYVPGVRPNGAIHGGYVSAADEILLSDAVAALSSERGLENMTVTLVAKNGELIVNANAKDVSQAARIDRIAKRVSHGHSSMTFTTQTG